MPRGKKSKEKVQKEQVKEEESEEQQKNFAFAGSVLFHRWIVERACSHPEVEKIFSYQYAEDLASGGNDERSKRWVIRLPDIMKTLNNSVTRLTGRRPLAAFLDERVAWKKFSFNRPVGFEEPRLKIWSLVRFLLRLGEEEGDDRRRATDPIWSWKFFEIERMRIIANQPILYFLEGGPRRGFVREELQVVPEDTEDPPKKGILD